MVNIGTVVVTSDSALVSWELPSIAVAPAVMTQEFIVTLRTLDELLLNMTVSGMTLGASFFNLAGPPGLVYTVSVVAVYSAPDLRAEAREFNFTQLAEDEGKPLWFKGYVSDVPPLTATPPLVDEPASEGLVTSDTISVMWSLPDDTQFLTAIVITVESTSLLSTQGRRRRQGDPNEMRLLPTDTSTTVDIPPYSTNVIMVDAELRPDGSPTPIRTPLTAPLTVESEQGRKCC